VILSIYVLAQILTKLETFVPIDLLLKMFHSGIKSLTQSKSLAGNEEQKDVKESDINVAHEDDDDVPNLKCFIMMLDVLLKQVQFYLLHNAAAKHSRY